MNLSSSPARLALAAGFLALAPAALAQGTTATLQDGTLLTIDPGLLVFGTEGPIWHIDPATQEIFAMGKAVTIPALVDGVAVGLGGTSDGAGGEIGAGNMDRLLDVNAQPTGRDAVGVMSGAVRSIYASDRFLQNEDPRVVARIQGQWNTAHASTAQAHAGVVLPGNAPTGYPVYSGGTLKCAGHVYRDGAGNPYLIPDMELFVEFAENVILGFATGVSLGAGLHDSTFVVDDMLCSFNTDPRFPVEAIGASGPMDPFVMLQQMAANPGLDVGIGGYAVGEGHMIVITLESENAVDPTTPPTFSAQSWIFRDDRDELRFRGFLDKPVDENGVAYGMGLTLLDAAGAVLLDRPEVVTIDPLTGIGEYRVRSRNEVTVADISAIEVYATEVDANGVTVEVPNTRAHWERADVE